MDSSPNSTPHPEAPPPVLPASPAPRPLPPEASTELPEVEVTYSLTLKDLNAFVKEANRERNKKEKPILFVVIIGMVIFAIWNLYITVNSKPKHINHIKNNPTDAFLSLLPYGVSFIVLLIFILAFLSYQVKSQSKELADPHTSGISPNFFHARNSAGENKLRWSSIKNITMTETHFFLLFDNQTGHVIPKNAFASNEEAIAFYEKAKSYWEASHNNFV
jgi:hypothetical protein